MKKILNLSLVACAAISFVGHAHGQTLYSADWSTLAGSDGAYTVSMTLESGAAIGGTTAYTLTIANDNGRTYFNNGSSALTSGPYKADVDQETNRFSISAALFSGQANLRTSDVVRFTNITGIEGQILNPFGSTKQGFPINLSESDATTLTFESRNFGFDTLRTDPDADKGGTDIWDEYTFELNQTWTAVPEPSSAALFGIASIGILLRRRR